ncbi:unnamed protein product [Amoebophrya sp. A120]|nr:unnamed protein product [Amoebophrya sp. A120]|eukprot:GSA120T00024899001.1
MEVHELEADLHLVRFAATVARARANTNNSNIVRELLQDGTGCLKSLEKLLRAVDDGTYKAVVLTTKNETAVPQQLVNAARPDRELEPNANNLKRPLPARSPQSPVALQAEDNTSFDANSKLRGDASKDASAEDVATSLARVQWLDVIELWCAAGLCVVGCGRYRSNALLLELQAEQNPPSADELSNYVNALLSCHRELRRRNFIVDQAILHEQRRQERKLEAQLQQDALALSDGGNHGSNENTIGQQRKKKQKGLVDVASTLFGESEQGAEADGFLEEKRMRKGKEKAPFKQEDKATTQGASVFPEPASSSGSSSSSSSATTQAGGSRGTTIGVAGVPAAAMKKESVQLLLQQDNYENSEDEDINSEQESDDGAEGLLEEVRNPANHRKSRSPTKRKMAAANKDKSKIAHTRKDPYASPTKNNMDPIFSGRLSGKKANSHLLKKSDHERRIYCENCLVVKGRTERKRCKGILQIDPATTMDFLFAKKIRNDSVKKQQSKQIQFEEKYGRLCRYCSIILDYTQYSMSQRFNSQVLMDVELKISPMQYPVMASETVGCAFTSKGGLRESICVLDGGPKDMQAEQPALLLSGESHMLAPYISASRTEKSKVYFLADGPDRAAAAGSWSSKRVLITRDFRFEDDLQVVSEEDLQSLKTAGENCWKDGKLLVDYSPSWVKPNSAHFTLPPALTAAQIGGTKTSGPICKPTGVWRCAEDFPRPRGHFSADAAGEDEWAETLVDQEAYGLAVLRTWIDTKCHLFDFVQTIVDLGGVDGFRDSIKASTCFGEMKQLVQDKYKHKKAQLAAPRWAASEHFFSGQFF